MLIGISVNALGISGQSFKLQLAGTNGACTISLTYSDVSPISGDVRYYANTGITDGVAMAISANDPTDGANTVLGQNYVESNTSFTNSRAAIPVNQDGEWDVSLNVDPAAKYQRYCFRAVKSDSTLLDTYTVLPEITIHGSPDEILIHGQRVSSGTKTGIDLLRP